MALNQTKISHISHTQTNKQRNKQTTSHIYLVTSRHAGQQYAVYSFSAGPFRRPIAIVTDCRPFQETSKLQLQTIWWASKSISWYVGISHLKVLTIKWQLTMTNYSTTAGSVYTWMCVYCRSVWCLAQFNQPCIEPVQENGLNLNPSFWTVIVFLFWSRDVMSYQACNISFFDLNYT